MSLQTERLREMANFEAAPSVRDLLLEAAAQYDQRSESLEPQT